MSDQQPQKRKAPAKGVELEKRLRIVQEWIIEDWPVQDIVANIINKWCLTDRHARRYIAAARDKWLSEENAIIAQRRRLKIESLKKLKRSLQEKFKGTPAGVNAILRVEREIILLDGLRAPIKMEHSGPKGAPIQQNVNSVHRVIFEDYSKKESAE